MERVNMKNNTLSTTIKYLVLFAVVSTLSGCAHILYGEEKSKNPPYFITKEPTVIKKILLPKGTRLVYEEAFLKKGLQTKLMNENKLTHIWPPQNNTFKWAGVPVAYMYRFFNTDMSGFTVQANFSLLENNDKTKFSEMWQSCNDRLGIEVKDLNDWSFNLNNVTDITDCSAGYQRYFKDNKKVQNFLDDLYFEMRKVRSYNP